MSPGNTCNLHVSVLGLPGINDLAPLSGCLRVGAGTRKRSPRTLIRFWSAAGLCGYPHLPAAIRIGMRHRTGPSFVGSPFLAAAVETFETTRNYRGIPRGGGAGRWGVPRR
jgi:hypothetical protein